MYVTVFFMIATCHAWNKAYMIQGFEKIEYERYGRRNIYCKNTFQDICTGKSLSEVLILASINPLHDNRLLVELQEKYKRNTCCVHKLFFVFVLTFKTICVHNVC
jgi:hypothetical protein